MNKNDTENLVEILNKYNISTKLTTTELENFIIDLENKIKEIKDLNIINPNLITCDAITLKGTKCKSKPIENGLCKKHQNYKNNTQIHNKKYNCNAIKKDKTKCNIETHNKPEGSENYYCFRHIKNWKNFE